MVLGAELRLFAGRIFAPIFLAGLVFAILLVFVARPAPAGNVEALIKQLDRTEWEIVREEVTKRLPSLISGEEEHAHFKQLMQSSQEIAAMAHALQYGDYEGLGALSANILARDLDKMVARRFGKDSRLYKSVQIVKDNPALARELTRAALNADAYAAKQAIGKSLKEYASEQVSKIREQGETFWKDMLRSVVPGEDRLARLGVDPVDLYLQGIRDWSDFTSRARLRFNNGMLDCLALRYRKIRSEGGSHADARLEIENFDTGTGIGSNFDCSKEKDRIAGGSGEKSVTQRIVDFFTSTGRSAAALAELGLTSGEIVDLIEQYGQTGARNRGDEFSEWLQERLLKNVRTRADSLRAAIAEEQERVARQQISEAERLMAAIEAEIAKLDRDKPGDPDSKGRSGKDKPVAGKREKDDDTSRRAADKGEDQKKPEPEKVTLQCERLTALVASARRASASESGKLAAELTAAEAAARGEDNCGPEVFASATSARDRLQKISTLRDRLQAAIRDCNVSALPSLKSEASSLGSAEFDNEITLLKTARTAVSQFNNGKAAFDGGNYAGAKGSLQRALLAFRELPSGACQNFADRAQNGLDEVEKIMAQKVIVDRAINTCDVDDLKGLLAKYQNRKFRFFTESVARIRAALPDCEEKERIIAEGEFCDEMRGKVDAASADFKANRLKAARRALLALDKQLTSSNTKRCSDLPGRVRQGLANLDTINAEYDRFARAEKACDVDTLNKLVAQYRRKKHPWFSNAVTRARGVIEDCRESREQEAEAKFCDEMRGKVDAASADFMANRLKAARQALLALDRDLTPSNTQECPNLRVRVQRGLDQLDALNTEYGRLNQAANDCNVEMLNTLVTRYRRERHPWFKKAASLANGRIDECQDKPPSREEAIADCRRQVAAKGKVYATTRFKPDGSYSCHWCESGQIPQGNVCVPDRRTAEADCRRQAAAKGKIYAKTEIYNDGRYNCLWCEAGRTYANGKCWTPAQLADAKCRQDVARRGKVYGRAVVLSNGQYRCLWCEPGQYYANGQCYSRQQAQPRVPPQPRVAPRAPSSLPCNPSNENYGKCWGNPQPQKLYPCMHRKGMGPFGC